MEVTEDDVRKAFAMPRGRVVLHLLQRQPGLVLEVRSRQPFLDAVHKLARGPLRNQL